MARVSLVSVCAALMALSCAAQSPRPVPLNWNAIVDFILESAREEIRKLNIDEVPLPEVREEFRRRWGFILIDTRFKADRGWLKSLSSIERRGDASVVLQDSTYTLTCDISMTEAKIRYEHYEVEMWDQAIFSGNIKGDIGNNRMRVTLDFDLQSGECVSRLREVKVIEIGGFDVQVSGLGPLDDLASQISTWVSEKRQGQIINEMEYYLSKEIIKSLDVFYCDQYIGLLQL